MPFIVDTVLDVPLNEDSVLEFDVTLDGNVMDVTGCSFLFLAKINRDDTDGNAVITKVSSDSTQLRIINAGAGVVYVYLTAGDLPNLLPTQPLYFQLRITATDGRTGVVLSGYLLIKP
jgi:hypothetical protein